MLVQLARCFRDEATTPLRQPEFTQLDIELAFASPSTIQTLTEGLIAHVFQTILGLTIPTPFPRMSYAEVMSRYGSDKPDTRYGMELADVTPWLQNCAFRVISDAVGDGGVAKAIVAGDAKQVKAKRLKPGGDLFKLAVQAGASGLCGVRVGEGTPPKLEGPKPLVESLSEDKVNGLVKEAGAGAGSLLIIAADKEGAANAALDAVRYGAVVAGPRVLVRALQ